MITFSGTTLGLRPMITRQTVTASSPLALMVKFVTGSDVTTQQCILEAIGNTDTLFLVQIINGTLHFLQVRNDRAPGGDAYCPIAPSTAYTLCLSTDLSAAPAVWLNGAPVVLTDGASVFSNNLMSTSYWRVFLGTKFGLSPLLGGLGEFAWFTSMTEDIARRVGAPVYRLPLYVSECIDDWVFDKTSVAHSAAGISADGDLQAPWGSATPHYLLLQNYDGSSLTAGKSDDEEEELFTCSTTNIAGGRVVGIQVEGRSASIFQPLGITLKLGAAFEAIDTPGTFPLFVAPAGGWTQAQLDAMEMKLTSGQMTGTASIDYIRLHAIYNATGAALERLYGLKAGTELVRLGGANMANTRFSYQ